MNAVTHSILGAAITVATLAGCASGRVRGAQGTEMGQQEAYEPSSKVDPPVANVQRTSGLLELPDPPPVLEVDLERRREPPPAPEPEPKPKTPQKPKTP